MKEILFLLFFLLCRVNLKNITPLKINDTLIDIDEKGIHYYSISFPSNPVYSTYYISTESNDKAEQNDMKLFLGGDCIDNCSNLVSLPDEDGNCGQRKNFLNDNYLVKLVPNKGCSLFFSIMAGIKTKLLLDYETTIQVHDVQSLRIKFKIPKAPIFLEYIPRFPGTFVSLAKIYVDLTEKNVKAIYFGKDSDFEQCNTHYPDADTHCYAFQLPSCENPRQYFVAFDYVKVLTSNLYIGIYPKEGIESTKVTIGYNMPFIVDGLDCPPQNYLAIQNSDIYCANCSKNCLECNASSCLKCESKTALLNSMCFKHDCETFAEYKDKTDQCLKCEGNCQFCKGEHMCLQCKENYIKRPKGNCELQARCNASQYYNSDLNQCENCSEGCEICLSSQICLKCYEAQYFFTPFNFTCNKYQQCKPHQYMSEDKTRCLNCSENCTRCSDVTNCITCGGKNVMRNGLCVPDCGNNKFYNFEISKCDDCLKHCKECSQNKTCYLCKPGFYKNGESECKESPLCKPNQHLSSAGDTCVDCPSNCTSCRNSSFCLACKQGLAIVGHQICAPSCQTLFFYNMTAQKCSSCIENCEFCLDGSTCEKCRNGLNFNFVGDLGKCSQALSANALSSIAVLIGIAFLTIITIK